MVIYQCANIIQGTKHPWGSDEPMIGMYIVLCTLYSWCYTMDSMICIKLSILYEDFCPPLQRTWAITVLQYIRVWHRNCFDNVVFFVCGKLPNVSIKLLRNKIFFKYWTSRGKFWQLQNCWPNLYMFLTMLELRVGNKTKKFRKKRFW